MFLRYYGLNEQPFGTTPDPRFLHLSASHREAFASLVYGIETGRGFVGLIAEPGMGKTTLLFQLMEKLQNSARTVFLFQTQTNTREFLSNLIADLGLDPTGQDVASLQRQLNEILIREAQMGRQFVLIIDEAQDLEDSVLESVRMLSNFETARTKLMQIVLAGQPPLADKLSRPELEQLKQRVSIICRLEPFNVEEVAVYIGHRLEMAGYKGGQLFTPEAISIIAAKSGGIPRNVNNMCFHALSLAYAQGKKRIDRSIVEEVLDDLDLEFVKDRRSNPQIRPKVQKDEPGGLEGVTLNNASGTEESDDFRILFHGQGRGRPSTSPRRRSVAGGRQQKPRNSRWLVWAVAMLTLVLAGELFWAYLPAGAPPQSVERFVGAALGQAKQIVLQHKDQNQGNAQAAVAPKTIYLNPSTSGNTIAPAATQDPNTLTADPTTSLNISSNGQKPGGASPEAQSAAEPSGKQSSRAQAAPAVAKGKLILESNVGPGVITINGHNKPGWQTPHVFTLSSGTYGISISKAGYSTWSRDVRVSSGHKKLIVANLRVPRGVIVIDTEPPGMLVYIDGKSYGPSEVEATLRVGKHTYRVVPPHGQKSLTGTFVLKPDTILTRKIRWLSNGRPSAAQNTPNPDHFQKGATSTKRREQS